MLFIIISVFTILSVFALAVGNTSFEEILTDVIIQMKTLYVLVITGFLFAWKRDFYEHVKETNEFIKGKEFYKQQLKDYEVDYDKFEMKEDEYISFVRHAGNNYKIFCFKEGFEFERKNHDYIVKMKHKKKTAEDKIGELLGD